MRLHRVAALDGRDYRSIERIPVTAPWRTLLDFAEQAQPRELERAFDEALTQRLISHRQMRELVERSPGRRGIAAIRALLDRDHGTTLTDSELEELMLALIRAAGLPHPETRVEMPPYRLDFYWPDRRLNVEVDGYKYHSIPSRLEANRRRDADLKPRVDVLRFTDRQITRDPHWVVARLAQALAPGRPSA